MGIFIDPDDLAPFASIPEAKAEIMVNDAEAMAVLAAPCLGAEPLELTEAQENAVKAILRGAILRWNEAGTGALAAQTAGPFGQTIDTRNERRSMFNPTEINDLQGLCGGTAGSVYSLDLSGPDRGAGYWSAPNVWTPL